ncbi:SWI/SNF complex subunit SWI3C isoform X2 [Olea europaea var. sylvestris]|uniref:SWI/SNF complex subunit SWI3C isoform X2 n=1 Tax=Olea europaea var. sylvestris TaxID=158386 RepID=UPI000C1D6F24|nr:SWI/SNF complex subunit SWI3C isoform X2 [Olea europaea var. sylvestris]
MPASSSDTRTRWRKRKREHPKSKLKEPDNDDVLEDNEYDDDHDMDPPQNHPETDDNPPQQNANHMAQISRERESEKLVDDGVKICEFPVAIKRVVSRPHPLVLGIVEAERATHNGVSRSQGQGMAAFLENISYGQLQALSAVPQDSPALLGAAAEETASCSGGGSYVIVPPGIVPGSGVTKRFGSAGRVHILPVHADWFSPNSVHRLERQVVPHFFSGKSADHTPEKYIECRNFIVAKYMENPEKHLSVSDCEGLVAGIDHDDLTRIVRFLNHWGIINYCATPLNHGPQKDGTYLCEDSNGELCVPSAALKSIDSLILFDKPKCRLKATEVYTKLARQQDEDTDFDSTIREKLSEHRCNYCSRSIPTVYYQSEKEVDAMLCLDCFHEGRFIAGHSSLDFVRVSSIKDYGDVDGDDWSDQETLLLLEGMQLYNENWDKISVHVGTKSRAQCILHFVRLPLDGAPLETIDVPSISGSSSSWNQDDHGRSQLNSNGCSLQDSNSASKFPFANSENPVMNLVAFLASALGPRVAAACAHASLGALCKDGGKEESPRGETMNFTKKSPWSQHDAEAVQLSAESVRAAAEAGLAAAATKAKLFADHEEREIQRLSANIVNHQMKRLELKLKQFAEVETLLMRECEQMERTRQRFAAERALMMSAQFGPAGTSRSIGPQTVANAVVNNAAGNNGQQVSGSQQPFVSGYGSNQPIHPHISLIQQHGMYGLGPRLPLSSLHPSSPSSGANAVFSPPANSQPSIGHPIRRSLSGSKSSLG